MTPGCIRSLASICKIAKVFNIVFQNSLNAILTFASLLHHLVKALSRFPADAERARRVCKVKTQVLARPAPEPSIRRFLVSLLSLICAAEAELYPDWQDEPSREKKELCYR